MHSTADTGKVWVGVLAEQMGRLVLMIENDQGEKVLMLAAGTLVPENWLGRRVRVQVDLCEDEG